MDVSLYDDERCKMKLEPVAGDDNTALAVLGCYIDSSPDSFGSNANLSKYLFEKPHLYKLPKGVRVLFVEPFDDLLDATCLMILEKMVPITREFQEETSALLDTYHFLLEKAGSERDRIHARHVYSKLCDMVNNYKGIFPRTDQDIATFRTKLQLTLDDL